MKLYDHLVNYVKKTGRGRRAETAAAIFFLVFLILGVMFGLAILISCLIALLAEGPLGWLAAIGICSFIFGIVKLYKDAMRD